VRPDAAADDRDGAGVDLVFAARDAAGNLETDAHLPVRIDTTAPTMSVALWSTSSSGAGTVTANWASSSAVRKPARFSA
jgi:hypothetical protein